MTTKSLATAIETLVEAALAEAALFILHREPPTTASSSVNSKAEPPVAARDLVDAICQERHGLRLEVIQMEASMHRAVLGFVTIAGVFAGIYWDKRVIPDVSTRAILLAGLTQVEFFMALFMLSLYVNQNVHVGYIRALEGKINQVCGSTITAWDSHITRGFLGHYRAAFFWLQAVLFLTLASFFIWAIWLVSSQIGKRWVIFFAILETFWVVVFAVWGLIEVKRVNRSADKVLGISPEVQSDSRRSAQP
jgi:hypothetical protein